jgi:quercetin dioxygenase-like cupin family protein
MDIKRSGSQPSAKGHAEYFTGNVRIDPLFEAPDPARARGASVTFEPGARSAWHTHPLGQTLIVTSGCGWVQSEGGPKMEIRSGDVVWCPPKEKHWHGATPTTAMTHIAIQEQLDGKVVEWKEKVSDEQYAPSSPPETRGKSLCPGIKRGQATFSKGQVGWLNQTLRDKYLRQRSRPDIRPFRRGEAQR